LLTTKLHSLYFTESEIGKVGVGFPAGRNQLQRKLAKGLLYCLTLLRNKNLKIHFKLR